MIFMANLGASEGINLTTLELKFSYIKIISILSNMLCDNLLLFRRKYLFYLR